MPKTCRIGAGIHSRGPKSINCDAFSASDVGLLGRAYWGENNNILNPQEVPESVPKSCRIGTKTVPFPLVGIEETPPRERFDHRYVPHTDPRHDCCDQRYVFACALLSH